MNNVERFRAIFEGKEVDRLPYMEWAAWWWKETVKNWQGQGLDSSLDRDGVLNYFGLDAHKQVVLWESWLPAPSSHGAGYNIKSMDDYNKLKSEDTEKRVFPPIAFAQDKYEIAANLQRKGESVLWVTFRGFFDFPRKLFGIEPHMYSFYDYPEIMHAMNEDLLNYHLKTLDQLCNIETPVFCSIMEDLSYNSGPMISKSIFNEFMKDYYKRLTKALKERGIYIFVDSDGDVTEPLDWFLDAGADGMLPMEARCTDIVSLGEKYPEAMFIGGFNKFVMVDGEEAIRNEFDRLLPLIKRGKYIPSPDHQTPPEVSLENYTIYTNILKEYANRFGSSV